MSQTNLHLQLQASFTNNEEPQIAKPPDLYQHSLSTPTSQTPNSKSDSTSPVTFPFSFLPSLLPSTSATMAGARPKYRHFNRSSAHRQAMLRNLVTSLLEHETISTTWQKAKEAQRLAEQLVTLGKKNTEASRRRAMQILYVCRYTSPFYV